MKYITLTRGNEEIWYPMFEVKSEYIGNGLSWNPFTSQGGSVSGATSGGSIPGTIQVSLDNIFNDSIPTHASDFGSIIQTEDMFEQDPDRGGNWLKRAGGDYIEVPVGEKPDNWDSNYFDYCVITQDNYWQMWLYAVPVGDGQIDNPPTWDASTQYYKNNTSDVRQRFNHIFKTDAGYTFGIWTGTGTGFAGYNKHYSRLGTNPGSTQFNAANKVYWRNRNGNVIDFTGLVHDAIVWYSALTLMDLSPYGESGYSTNPLTNESRTYYIFVYVTYQDTTYYGIANIGLNSGGAPVNIRMLLFSENLWGADSISDNPPPPEDGEWGEDSTSGGGNGTFQVTQDDLSPSDVSIDVRRDRFNDVFNNGGINVYQINTMDFGTIIGILYGSDFWDKFKNSMFNPLSAVLSCHLLPANLRGVALANTKHLTLAGFDVSAEMTTPIDFPLISSMQRFVVGSFDFNNPRYSDSFTDFAPNTIAILHLPYIGECEIDINAFMYGTLILEYICDNVSGNCAAWVWNKDRNGHGRLKYVFTGNCATNVPLFSMSQDGSAVGRVAAQAIIGVGAIALGVGLTAATGGTGAGALALGGVAKRIGARTLASAAVGGLALGATKAATDGLSTAQHLQSTGGISGNAGAIGDYNAWLEIIRPVWSNPSEYQALNGIPSNVSTKLSECSGFTQVTSIEIEGCTATADEVEELKSILESGIIIRQV